jgi:cold-inducible RNA-binding protein
LFAEHGPVDQVNIVKDGYSGQPRGFAFVEMPNVADADKAIAALNGTQFGGRTLNVNEARPRPERVERGGERHRTGSRW